MTLPRMMMVGFLAGAAFPAAAEDLQYVETALLADLAPPAAETFFGTVVAKERTGLSYTAGGCITEVSTDALRSQRASAGQVLVRLDDRRAQLALRTARARLAELEGLVEERDLGIASAIADGERRQAELEFVTREHQRNSVMLGRGLINETTMDVVERRFMDAGFAADRAQEAIISARAAKRRAEIARDIGALEVDNAELTAELLVLRAPYDGVLVDFDAAVGDCVQNGGEAAQLYAPAEKSVETFFLVSRLSAMGPSGIGTGQPVGFTRVNGDVCGGTVRWVDTEADLETQYVKATLDVDGACASRLFLNEAVEVTAGHTGDGVYHVPEAAVEGEAVLSLVGQGDTVSLTPVEVLDVQGGIAAIRYTGEAALHVLLDGDASEGTRVSRVPPQG
ncbi:efflux RND transporter periplasmic adaptor subunit [Pseudaestuariivita sp.]|uniref:efflux RND transporter periplasmic adaptor subunit n=1 Tax=Pseudaestuariivita sp. TaxID=2211669 RepID=UPI00405A2C4E